MTSIKSNLPAVVTENLDRAGKVVNFLTPPAKFVDKLMDAPLQQLAFEKPTSAGPVSRGTLATMAAVYGCAAIGALIPFAGTWMADATVLSAGAGAAFLGNKTGNEDMANQGRLAMQTGIYAGTGTVVSIVPVVGYVGNVLNSWSYIRAAIKSGSAAINAGKSD